MPVWTHLADTRLGAIRVLVVSSVATVVFAVALFVTPDGFVPILLAAGAMSVCSGPGTPLSDALAVAYLGDERMSEYGRIRLWASLGWGVAVIVFGALYQRVGLESVLPLYALGTAGFALWTLRLPRGVLVPVRAESRLGALGDVFRASPGLAAFTLRLGDQQYRQLRRAVVRESAHRRHRRRPAARRPCRRARSVHRDPRHAVERRRSPGASDCAPCS